LEGVTVTIGNATTMTNSAQARLPSRHGRGGEGRARALAESHLATALPQRWRHVQAVAAEAARLCAELRIVRNVVVCAAWLHDIGYAPTLVDTGFHPLDGARYLRAQGWADEICRLVAHHTDAARQADAHGLGDQLRAEFRELDGVALDVLWTADATTGPSGQRMTLDERITEIANRYGADHPVTEAMFASRQALEAAIVRTMSGAAGSQAPPSGTS
jgi:putative nucleotidyltransferase with HDIG domain